MRHRIGLLAAVFAVVMTVGASSAAVASPAAGVSVKPSGCVDMKKITTKLPADKAKAILAACRAKKKQGSDVGKKDDVLAGLAKRFGIPEKRLVKALVDLKLALAKNCMAVSDPAVIKRFASDLGVPPSKAKAVLAAMFGGESKQGRSGKLCDVRGHGKPGDDRKPGDQGRPGLGKPGDLDKSGKAINKPAA